MGGEPQAEENGEVVAFLVENGQAVQYGQAILEVRPFSAHFMLLV